MDNQHQHIKGYRDLSAEEIALVNEIKSKAEEVGELVKKLYARTMQGDEFFTADPTRWIMIGKTHLQQGFMALIRAVTKPTTF